jgi:hypothetical protein
MGNHGNEGFKKWGFRFHAVGFNERRNKTNMAETTALFTFCIGVGAIILGIFYFFFPFLLLGRLTDIRVQQEKTNIELKKLQEISQASLFEQKQTNQYLVGVIEKTHASAELSRQLLRTYGHEPEV